MTRDVTFAQSHECSDPVLAEVPQVLILVGIRRLSEAVRALPTDGEPECSAIRRHDRARESKCIEAPALGRHPARRSSLSARRTHAQDLDTHQAIRAACARRWPASLRGAGAVERTAD